MCPGDPPHETSTSIGQRAIEAAFPVSHYVRVKAPLVFGLSTDPEPDLAVVVGDARNYSNAHPETASLVVEVADSSRLFDLKDKANLYAAGKISDYWVIDLQKRRLVVHRDPQPDSEKCFGHGYATVTEHAAGESVKPLLAEKPVAVSDLLP